MDSKSIILMAIISLAIIVVGTLKLMNIKYQKKEEKKFLGVGSFSTHMPSYKEYERISQKTSPKNKPKRETGDFFDYIFTPVEDIKECIEDKILSIYGEDLKDETTNEQ